MRILYIDIDTLRPDHLGCYGYHRPTSPNIDWIASQGVRFENCYAPDVPCLPSRSALYSGRFGFRTGVINHGGTAADPFVEGPTRGFRDVYDRTAWIPEVRRAGLRTVSISPFGERHSAWWWYAGWNEVYNPGSGGMEIAEDVTPLALDWLERNGRSDDWFLHVNYWDPHTPYRTPLDCGDPFAGYPLPEWLTEDVRRRCWDGFGPHSAQEPHGEPPSQAHLQRYPRLPLQIDSMESLRRWIDGYDTGIWYADRHVGMLLRALEQAGVLDQTVLIVSSDHGENQGELNVWGDHQTADHITCCVPLLIRWPGMTQPGLVNAGLHYNFDWAATLLELLGRETPANWDGRSFAGPLRNRQDGGREYLVLSQGAWACQRSARFDRDGHAYLLMRTYHDGHKQVEPLMLFDLTLDPHEQVDLSSQRPDLVGIGLAHLSQWEREMMLTSPVNIDPMMTVLREGGPLHTRNTLPAYVRRLRETGRAHHAERLIQLHPDEV